ncbi:uncharacterized protein LOC129950292 [Eupeodes corollae]|uniref:uncharacterized protein LOC129950292 n=1 Tax=Eupeodes corollae TaxID=290404 RepID=UPI00249189A7|nr:uncharacterized protein LOC129950292 [Eupeodes corollae]
MKDDPDTNVQFVKMIERNPCVYNRKSRDFSNKAEQDETWKMIGIEFDATVAECKERWKNLRACFTRHLKLIASPGYSSIDKKPYYLAEHLNFLKPFTKSRTQFFSVPKLKPKLLASFTPKIHEKEDNLSETEQHYNEVTVMDENDPNIQDSSDTNLTQIDPRVWNSLDEVKPTVSNKRHRVDNEEQNVDVAEDFPKRRQLDTYYEEDLDLCFFKSLLPDIRQMNSDQKRRFKVGVINLSGTILNEGIVPFLDYQTIKREYQQIERTLGNNTHSQTSNNLPKTALASQSGTTHRSVFPLLGSKNKANQSMQQIDLNSMPNYQANIEYIDNESRPGSVQSTLSSDSSILEFKLPTEELQPFLKSNLRTT